MGSYKSDIARLWVGIVERDILNNRKSGAVQVAMRRCSNILPCMCAIDRVMHFPKV